MAPVCETCLCDLLCELPEPHGAKGATSFGDSIRVCAKDVWACMGSIG
jgi:hypothetical protein